MPDGVDLDFGAAVVTPTLSNIRRLQDVPNVQTLQIDLLQPLSQYFDYRINQLDLRLSKIVRSGGRKFQVNADVYNAMNGSYALWTNNNYGTNGATWLRPTSTFDARLVKFGVQYDF